MKKSIDTIIVLMIITFVLPLLASRPYQPKMADPILEPWRWRSYPELDGKGVLNMTEAADGSIWFGLQKGAMHYDGLNWMLYDDQNSLLNSIVHVIIEAHDGSLYFGTQTSGLIRLVDGMWETVWSPAYTDTRDQSVVGIVQTSDHSIWVSIWKTGILAIQNDRQILFTTREIREEIEDQYPEVTFIEIPQNVLNPSSDGSSDLDPYWVCEIEPGELLFVVNSQIFRYRMEQPSMIDQGTWIDITPEAYPEIKTISQYVVKVLKSRDGSLWIYSSPEYAEIFHYDPDHNSWSRFDLSQYGGNNRLISMQETADGILWVGNFNRFFSYREGHWRLYESPELQLPNIDILFLASSDGNLWIAGQRSSVYRIDYTGAYWMTYSGLNYQCESDQMEWFVSVGGSVVSHNKTTGMWTQYDVRDGVIDRPMVMLCTQEGNIWVVGSHQMKSAVALFREGKWIKTIHPSLGEGFDYRSVCELLDGTLLFGVKDRDFEMGQTGGIARYHPSEDEWDYILPPMVPNIFCSIRQTQDSTIWYGGVYFGWFKGDTSSVVKGHEDFHSEWFDYIEVAPDGALWTIKGGVGVYRYDPVQELVEKYTAEDGLAGVLGSSILCLSDTSVLIGTDKGISRFDGHSWTTYGLPEVLKISRESGDMRQSQDGSIWLNMASRSWYQRAMDDQHYTEKMLPEFRTIRFKPDRLPPDTQVDIAEDRVPSLGNVYVDWSGTDAWNQSLANHLEYAYRLNGGEWSPFSAETSHLFLSLKSGDYLLEVRARDGGLNIDPTPATVRFTVMPPVWRQGWFLGMVVLFVGAIAFFQWRVVQRDRRLCISNVSLQERTEELQATNEQLESANKKIMKTSRALKRSNKELEQSKKILENTNKKALAREQYLMYALMNNVADKIYFKDKEGRFIRVNKATSMAHGIMDPDEMVGLTDFDFFDEEYARQAVEYEKDVMETGQAIEKEEKEKWVDGHEIWVSTMKQPLKDLKGNIVGTFGITRDITERKLSEMAIEKANRDIRQKAEALERSNRELQQFTYVAYHDLQEPLRMVASYVQLLSDRYQGKLDQDADEFIDYAVDGTKRIKRLISDLLIYSSITTKSKPFQSVDSEALFERVKMNLKGMIEESHVVLEHDRLPTVQADEDQLERLFCNLIDNAIKYHSKKRPEIHVSAEKNSKYWVFSVCDNGIGIAPEFHEKVFGIFKRLHNVKKYSGTGIGLAVCKKIVEHHGGKIWVESNLGEGAVFYFSLPIMEDVHYEQ